jgi:2,3-bisphosphoglycerate-dependent phosphoglycerate mutase
MDLSVNLTLMRHGRSRADDEGVFEGRYDAPLTEVGLAQVEARALGWKLTGVHFDRIFTSPLQRARATAEQIAKVLDAPLEVDADWMEMDKGPLTELTFAEGDRLYPRPIFRNPYMPIAGTGESEWELYTRAARAVERIVRLGPGSTLVVAHGGVINSALRAIIGVTPFGNRQGFSVALGDTGYLRLLYEPERHIWTLVEYERGDSPPKKR